MNALLDRNPFRFIATAAGIAIVLLVSWALPGMHALWDRFDVWVYTTLHSEMLQTEAAQRFWALMNSRIVDNISHTCFITVFLIYILIGGKKLWKTRFLRFLFIITTVVLSILASKGVQHFVAKKRESPSLVVGHQVALSEQFPELENVKDSSHRSFPGDHSVTLFILAAYMLYYCKRWPYVLFTALAIILFSLPRLISGGHWITDVLMGSLPIAVLAFIVWMGLVVLLNNHFNKNTNKL